jgi:hypothetical protein
MPAAIRLSTPYLHGNCEPCPACELQREAAAKARFLRDSPSCNRCKGKGYLPLSDRQIVARMVAEARAHYWPEVLARWAAQGGGQH